MPFYAVFGTSAYRGVHSAPPPNGAKLGSGGRIIRCESLQEAQDLFLKSSSAQPPASVLTTPPRRQGFGLDDGYGSHSSTAGQKRLRDDAGHAAEQSPFATASLVGWAPSFEHIAAAAACNKRAALVLNDDAVRVYLRAARNICRGVVKDCSRFDPDLLAADAATYWQQFVGVGPKIAEVIIDAAEARGRTAARASASARKKGGRSPLATSAEAAAVTILAVGPDPALTASPGVSQRKCGHCRQPGHDRRTCPQLQGTSASGPLAGSHDGSVDSNKMVVPESSTHGAACNSRCGISSQAAGTIEDPIVVL
jgi:hypothetical protein